MLSTRSKSNQQNVSSNILNTELALRYICHKWIIDIVNSTKLDFHSYETFRRDRGIHKSSLPRYGRALIAIRSSLISKTYKRNLNGLQSITMKCNFYF